MKSVSIITVCLNDAAGLEKTLESICAQSALGNLESVIIDGGSADLTREIITKYVNNGTIARWLSEKDTGIYNAMNKGIGLANGHHCLFLNAGDLLADDNVIENVLLCDMDKDIVYGNYIAENRMITYEQNILNLNFFLKSYLPHPASFISIDLLKKLGGYVESFKIAGDYEFFLRAILKKKASYKHVPITVSVHQLDGISNDPCNLPLVKEETEMARLMNYNRLYLAIYKKITKKLNRLKKKND